MKAIENPSTFLVRSTKNSSFGTAFCIKQDAIGYYFVTCSHVVDDCGAESLEIENHPAKVVAIGSKADIDLAVVFVEGLLECSVLKLSNESIEINQKFTIDGFKPYKKGSHKLERLNGFIKKISKIYSNSKSIDTYELNIGDGDSIERGYSGSAIVCDGFVVAVATDRNTNGRQAYAVPIGYLGEIWGDMPDDFFIKKLKTINSKKLFIIIFISLMILSSFIYPSVELKDTIYAFFVISLILTKIFLFLKNLKGKK